MPPQLPVPLPTWFMITVMVTLSILAVVGESGFRLFKLSFLPLVVIADLYKLLVPLCMHLYNYKCSTVKPGLLGEEIGGTVV